VTKRQRPVVAIDGPAGAGKSTVARKLAETLTFLLVDTGAIYRAVALAAKQRSVPWDDASAMGAFAKKLVDDGALRLDAAQGSGPRVRIDDQDVSDAIRAPDIGMGASTVSAHPGVRAALLDMQRRAGRDGGVVLEGRDIGTVVFPDAEVKFFLTARPDIRARRRLKELQAKGSSATFEEVLAEVVRRDEQDSTRPIAPLRQADDAQLVDDSDLSIEETVDRMAARVRAWRPR
jgi:cytidylate kinase